MNSPLDLIEHYGAAFRQADLEALLDCFAFPLRVVSVAPDGASLATAQAEDWRGVLKKLLGTYKTLGVTDCVPSAVEITAPLQAVFVVRVQWALRREGREPVYEFTAVYTLALTEGRLRIVTIAHDELPKVRRALQGIHNRTANPLRPNNPVDGPAG